MNLMISSYRASLWDIFGRYAFTPPMLVHRLMGVVIPYPVDRIERVLRSSAEAPLGLAGLLSNAHQIQEKLARRGCFGMNC